MPLRIVQGANLSFRSRCQSLTFDEQSIFNILILYYTLYLRRLASLEQ